MPDPSPFGEFLRERRLEAGLSARSLAQGLGLSHVAYGNVERGKQPFLAESHWPRLVELLPGVKIDTLRRLAEASMPVFRLDLTSIPPEARAYVQELAQSLNTLDTAQLHRLVSVLQGSDGRVAPLRYEDERVPRVAPLSKRDLVELADELLRRLQPAALESPRPVDIVRLVEGDLERVLGVAVYPVKADEIPGSEASTGGRVILVREDQLDFLHRGGPIGWRARATIAHELGHVLLHREILEETHTLRKTELVPRKELRAYEDPEWQAWTLAQCFLMPMRTVQMLEDRRAETLSAVYDVSGPFASGYLRRFGDWL